MKPCDCEAVVIISTAHTQTINMSSKVNLFWIIFFLSICSSVFQAFADSGQVVTETTLQERISVQYHENAFTEYYIPEGKTLPLSCGKQADGKSLVIVYPFFQDIVTVSHPQKRTAFPASVIQHIQNRMLKAMVISNIHEG